MPELALDELCLCLDVEASQPDGDLVAKSTLVVHGHLERGRCRLAPDAADADSIAADLGQLDGVEATHHVGIEVALALDLVQQLRGDRADRHLPTGARVLADHAGAIRRDLCPRESGIGHVGNLGEEAVVAPRGLPAALDHMSRNDRAGQSVPVVTSPAVMPRRGTGYYRSIGGAPGDDDVSTLIQSLDDAPAADVCVGGHDPIGQLAQGLTGVEMGEVVAGSDQVPQAVREIVAVDVGDRRVEAQPVCDLGHGVSAPRRIQAAGIGHHLDAPFQTGAHDLLHLRDESPGVAGARPLGRDARQDQHGQLGKPVAREGIDWTARDHLTSGSEAVPEETAAVGDPDGRRSRRAHVGCSPSSIGRLRFCRETRVGDARLGDAPVQGRSPLCQTSRHGEPRAPAPRIHGLGGEHLAADRDHRSAD